MIKNNHSEMNEYSISSCKSFVYPLFIDYFYFLLMIIYKESY